MIMCGPAEQQLEKYLHDHIPISQALGLRVLVAGPERVLLSAPLEPNINHRNTAFGGSIAAVATLAGWTWMHVMLRERSSLPRVVIRSSKIDYLLPIDHDFTAELRPPTEEAYDRFIESLDRRGSGRLTLTVEVICQGEVAATLEGEFVAIAT